MPLVHYVKKARKDNSAAKRGESYYWWKFAYDPRQYSKTMPKRSQLTKSDYKGCVYDLQDSVVDYSDISSEFEFDNMVTEIEDQVTDIMEQCEASRLNLRPNLQEVSPNAKLLKARAASCKKCLEQLDALEWDVDKYEENDSFDLSVIDEALICLDLDKGGSPFND